MSIESGIVRTVGEDMEFKDGLNIEAIITIQERKTIITTIVIAPINRKSKVIINLTITHIFVLTAKNEITLTAILDIIFTVIISKVQTDNKRAITSDKKVETIRVAITTERNAIVDG